MSIITIDGPAGSGKGTVANGLANRLGFIHLDSGAIYRCVTLQVLKQNIQLTETARIANIANEIKIEFAKDGQVLIDGENVTKAIRENDVNTIVAEVAKIKKLRLNVEVLQRTIAESNNTIVEGRDTGTVVFPNAEVKFYLDADVEERARRRYKENQEKGIESTYEEVLEIVKKRDYEDMNREFAPLKKPEDAITVDSTNLSIEEVLDKMEQIVKQKLGE